VRDSQRSRLIQAVWAAVGENGYGDTTVTDIVSRARCSRNAFYEFFSDKEECFLAACDGNNEQLLALLYAEGSASSWTEALRNGLRVYLSWWQDSPRIAMAYLTDLPTAGRRAIEQRDRTYDQFGLLFQGLAARARVEQPELPPLAPLAIPLLVSGLTELVGREVRAGRLDALDRLEDELTMQIVRALTS
jgi:AcrR family transcriptional regulator